MTISRHVGWSLIVALLCDVDLTAAEYHLDWEASRVVVWVPRAGMFGFLGHDHTIQVTRFEGQVDWDEESPASRRVTFSTNSGSLKVVDEGADEKERAEVQQTMESPDVLDIASHPQIHFSSTSIEAGESGQWIVTGDLSIRDVTQKISFPARIRFPNDQTVEAKGVVPLRPKGFGIEPVRAVGGAIRTADIIELRFHVFAER